MNWQEQEAMLGRQPWPSGRVDWPAEARKARESVDRLIEMWSRQKVYIYEDDEGWIGSLYADGDSRRWAPNPDRELRTRLRAILGPP